MSKQPTIEHMCPVYGCASCAYSWPAFDLVWWYGNKSEYECDTFPPGWYCANCLSQMPRNADNPPLRGRVTMISFLSALTESQLREHVARTRL